MHDDDVKIGPKTEVFTLVMPTAAYVKTRPIGISVKEPST